MEVKLILIIGILIEVEFWSVGFVGGRKVVEFGEKFL